MCHYCPVKGRFLITRYCNKDGCHRIRMMYQKQVSLDFQFHLSQELALIPHKGFVKSNDLR